MFINTNKGYQVVFRGEVIDWRLRKAQAVVRANSLAQQYDLNKEEFKVKRVEG